MSKYVFLSRLREGLTGLSPAYIEEIMADYSAHFHESNAHGRSEAEVAEALGDPARIARELRADIGLRRLEAHWSLSNLLAATMALAALVIVDLVLLLPLVIVAIVLATALGAVLMATGAIGLKILFTALFFDPAGTLTGLLAHLFIGIGLLSAAVGGGALLLMGISAATSMLGHYARLHFRAARLGQHAA